MRTLGIIGGMGPMATAYFMELIIDMTQADVDQQHIPMVVYNAPFIPDRTEYILSSMTGSGLEQKESPAKYMIEVGNALTGAGADIIAVPCMTAHFFHHELADAIPTPIIHGIEEVTSYLKAHGVQKVGVMATSGTVTADLFGSKFAKQNIDCVYPSKEKQEYVMDIIFNGVKAAKGPDMAKFHEVAKELFEAGAEVIVLGCTELSMVKRDYDIGHNFLDAMEVLAMKSVKACGSLKPAYEELIS